MTEKKLNEKVYLLVPVFGEKENVKHTTISMKESPKRKRWSKARALQSSDTERRTYAK